MSRTLGISTVPGPLRDIQKPGSRHNSSRTAVPVATSTVRRTAAADAEVVADVRATLTTLTAES